MSTGIELFFKISSWFLVINYFCKETSTKMFDRVLNTPLPKLLNIVIGYLMAKGVGADGPVSQF